MSKFYNRNEFGEGFVRPGEIPVSSVGLPGTKSIKTLYVEPEEVLPVEGIDETTGLKTIDGELQPPTGNTAVVDTLEWLDTAFNPVSAVKDAATYVKAHGFMPITRAAISFAADLNEILPFGSGLGIASSFEDITSGDRELSQRSKVLGKFKDYNPFKDKQLVDQGEDFVLQFGESFIGSKNPLETQLLVNRFKSQKQAMDTIMDPNVDMNNAAAVIGTMFAYAADPVGIAVGAPIVNGSLKGLQAVKMARVLDIAAHAGLSGTAASGADFVRNSIGSEFVNKSVEDQQDDIKYAMLFGGVFGAGFRTLATYSGKSHVSIPDETIESVQKEMVGDDAKIYTAQDSPIESIVYGDNHPMVNKAQYISLTSGDTKPFKPAGKIGKALNKIPEVLNNLTPAGRMKQSSFPSVREYNMRAVGVSTKTNVKGEVPTTALYQANAIEHKLSYDIDEITDLYKQYTDSGGKMSYNEFDKTSSKVIRALNNGADVSAVKGDIDVDSLVKLNTKLAKQTRDISIESGLAKGLDDNPYYLNTQLDEGYILNNSAKFQEVAKRTAKEMDQKMIETNKVAGNTLLAKGAKSLNERDIVNFLEENGWQPERTHATTGKGLLTDDTFKGLDKDLKKTVQDYLETKDVKIGDEFFYAQRAQDFENDVTKGLFQGTHATFGKKLGFLEKRNRFFDWDAFEEFTVQGYEQAWRQQARKLSVAAGKRFAGVDTEVTLETLKKDFIKRNRILEKQGKIKAQSKLNKEYMEAKADIEATDNRMLGRLADGTSKYDTFRGFSGIVKSFVNGGLLSFTLLTQAPDLVKYADELASTKLGGLAEDQVKFLKDNHAFQKLSKRDALRIGLIGHGMNNPKLKHVWGDVDNSLWASDKDLIVDSFGVKLSNQDLAKTRAVMDSHSFAVYGMTGFNNMVRSSGAEHVIDKVIKLAKLKQAGKGLPKGSKEYLNLLSMNEGDLGDILKQYGKHSYKEGDLMLSRFSEWEGARARKFQAALLKRMDETNIAPNIAEKPLLFDHAYWTFFSQLRSFQMASIQKFLQRDIHDGGRGALRMVLRTMMGSLSYTAKSMIRNDLSEVETDPAIILANGLLVSGNFPIFDEASNMLDSVAGLGLRSLAGQTEKFYWNGNTSLLQIPFGPSAKFFKDVEGWSTKAANGKFTTEDAERMARYVPLYGAFYTQLLLNKFVRK